MRPNDLPLQGVGWRQNLEKYYEVYFHRMKKASFPGSLFHFIARMYCLFTTKPLCLAVLHLPGKPAHNFLVHFHVLLAK